MDWREHVGPEQGARKGEEPSAREGSVCEIKRSAVAGLCSWEPNIT
jgi:hypothetical protein